MTVFTPSKKTQNSIVAMFFVTCALLIAGFLPVLPADVITNAIYVIGALGGIAIGGQAKVDWEEHRAKAQMANGNGHNSAPAVTK